MRAAESRFVLEKCRFIPVKLGCADDDDGVKRGQPNGERMMADTIEKPALMKRQMLIDGAWVPSVSGQIITVENPAKRVPIAEVPRGNAEDVDRAVQAACRAFPQWSRTVPRDRGKLLLKIADAMEARVEEIARLLAWENGNALRTQ